MKSVVITGSTRGIGLGLAREFIKSGCKVMISGRDPGVVQTCIANLRQQDPQAQVEGKACDVTVLAQVQDLWDFTARLSPQIDLWINNAGISHNRQDFSDRLLPEAQQVLRTNLDGLLNGCSVALKGMQAQGSGAIYNMLGLGSDGRIIKGLSIYGMSKAAAAYFSRALIQETRGGNVLVGTLSPGMVLTDLLLKREQFSAAEWEQMKKVYNILAEKVEVVTPWLVSRILANQKHGAEIRYGSPLRYAKQAVMALLGKRNILGED